MTSQRLPDALRQQLTHADLSPADNRTIVICTVDGNGHPHPAMLSIPEFWAEDSETIRLTTSSGSRTANNLRTRGLITAIVADVDGVFYIKGRATERASTDTHRASFHVAVSEVIEDAPAAHETARITTGIRFSAARSDQ